MAKSEKEKWQKLVDDLQIELDHLKKQINEPDNKIKKGERYYLPGIFIVDKRCKSTINEDIDCHKAYIERNLASKTKEIANIKTELMLYAVKALPKFEVGEKFWCIDDNGLIDYYNWQNDDIDKTLLVLCNIFKTKEEAEKYLALRKRFLKLEGVEL